jgi:glycosyltransferase involved in cell wall biosynthesis
VRILHVSEVAIGGVAALLRRFAEEQARRGHDVQVLAPPTLSVEASRTGWELHRKRPWSWWAASRALDEMCRRMRPDVIHLHSFVAGAVGRSPLSRTLAEHAVVYQPHSWNYDAARSRIQAKVLSGWERRAAQRCDVVVVNCADERVEGERHGIRAPTHVVGIPIDTEHFRPVGDADRADRRRSLDLAERRIITCLASLCWQKGQDRLLRAWERAPIEGADLVLVGGAEGPYLRRAAVDALRELAPTQWGRTIHSVGHQDDVLPWLQASDVLAQPSRYEALGVAVAEALACGLPVVTFEVNGAHEAVLSGPEAAAGSVVDQGDVDAFLDACRVRVLGEGQPGERSAARERALRLFAIDAVIDRVEDAYEHAVALAASRHRR